jgi:hypothetical protein
LLRFPWYGADACHGRGRHTGIAKLDLVFEQLHNSGRSPDDIDGEEIVDLALFYNYIPPGAVRAYAEALVREYAKFYREQEPPDR